MQCDLNALKHVKLVHGLCSLLQYYVIAHTVRPPVRPFVCLICSAKDDSVSSMISFVCGGSFSISAESVCVNGGL